TTSSRKDLLNDLVRASKQRYRDTDTKCLGGLEIDHKLELGRSLDGQLARLFTLEDTIDIRSCAPMLIDKVGAVGQQAASISVVWGSENWRPSIPRRKLKIIARCPAVNTSGIITRPAVGSPANAAIALSISALSCTVARTSFTPTDGAAVSRAGQKIECGAVSGLNM